MIAIRRPILRIPLWVSGLTIRLSSGASQAITPTRAIPSIDVENMPVSGVSGRHVSLD